MKRMTESRWKQVLTQGGVVDLSARAKWLLTGADRVRYLNGQVTQDVRRARADRAVYACVTDLKGRICGDIFVRVAEDGEGLLLDAEGDLREALGVRLERYIVADDAVLEDVTDEWQLWHFFGPATAQVTGASVVAERFGDEGRDVWVPATAKTGVAGELILTGEEVEVLRVVRGVPKHPQELNLDHFPPEAGLEIRAMDYGKGCYIGQEVLSRMRTTRKMPRELVRWVAEVGVEVEPGTPLMRPGAGVEKAAGEVTSVVVHPETGKTCGLAYVKQGTVPDDSRLLVGEVMANIEILL
jgi:folate-binding protein YgfZ